MLKSKTRCFSKGSIIADSQEAANGLMVITSGQVYMPSVFPIITIATFSSFTQDRLLPN